MKITTTLFTRFASMTCALTLIALLFAIDLQPGTAHYVQPPWDKLMHAGFYGALSLLLWWGLGKQRMLWILLVVAILGIAQESLQSFLPGRTPSVFDWLADMLGSALILGWVSKPGFRGKNHGMNVHRSSID